MKKYQEITFEVHDPGEVEAGILPYDNKIKIIIYEDPTGEDGEFECYMAETLKEWFDGAGIYVVDRRKFK